MLSEERVAIYCRLSQEDKNKKSKDMDSESIKNQKIMLMEYAREKKWKIVGVFVDEDWAGMNEKRPAYNEVLSLASNGKIDIILCKTLNRFTRDSVIVEKYVLEKFNEWNVRFVGLVDNIDTKLNGNRKSIQINALTNQWYIEDMSESIKAALTTKRKNGEYIGSTVLYGYLKDSSNKGHLVIDPVASEVVKEIFRLYSQGVSKTSIARILNDRGIPNPRSYKIEQGISKQNTNYNSSSKWKYFSISNILSNEMYMGNMVQGKYGSISFRTKKNKPKPKEEWIRVEGTHEAIIDDELWNKVSKMRKEKHRAYVTGELGMFTGKCRCEYCNSKLKSMKSHGNRYLRCDAKYISSGSCIGGFISEKILIQIVLKEINVFIEKYLDKNIFYSLNNRKEKSLKMLYEKEIASLCTSINQNKVMFKELFFQKAKMNITEEEFLFLNETIRSEKNKIEKMIEEKKKCLNELMSTHHEKDRKTPEITELSRKIVDGLIEKIMVGKRHIKIYWKI